MVRSATPSSTVSERWVSIRRAAEMLGVNQATLRQWGDAGKLRTFTTPGGHRRFSEGDLRALTSTSPTKGGRQAVADILLGCRERYEALVRRCVAENEWFLSFDESARRRFRILGVSMLALISSYLSGSRRERDRSLEEARDLAAEYGADAARVGLSLPQATEAFLLFRTPVLDRLSHSTRRRGPSAGRDAEDFVRRASSFMDQILVSMATAHEAARHASPEAVP